MTKPSGKLLLSKQVGNTLYEIKEGEGLWVLAYKKRPIRLVVSKLPGANNKPYIVNNKLSSWVNIAHGENRVDKLNKIFKTGDFSLLELWSEETAKPSASDTRSDRPGLLNRGREE